MKCFRLFKWFQINPLCNENRFGYVNFLTYVRALQRGKCRLVSKTRKAGDKQHFDSFLKKKLKLSNGLICKRLI